MLKYGFFTYPDQNTYIHMKDWLRFFIKSVLLKIRWIFFFLFFIVQTYFMVSARLLYAFVYPWAMFFFSSSKKIVYVLGELLFIFQFFLVIWIITCISYRKCFSLLRLQSWSLLILTKCILKWICNTFVEKRISLRK